MHEPLPPDALLAGLPDPMPELARRLSELLLATVPDAIERVRPGWRVIGYDVPLTPRRTAYFAWIMAQPEHVHLGFPRGVLLRDPDRLLEGAGITKLARWTTVTRPEQIDRPGFAALIEEAVAVARAPGLLRLARFAAQAESESV